MNWITSKLAGGQAGDRVNAALTILLERLSDNVADKGNWKHCLEQLRVICSNPHVSITAQWLEALNAVFLGKQYLFNSEQNRGASDTTGRSDGANKPRDGVDDAQKSLVHDETDVDLVKLALEVVITILREAQSVDQPTHGLSAHQMGASASTSAAALSSASSATTASQTALVRFFLGKALDGVSSGGSMGPSNDIANGGLEGFVRLLQHDRLVQHRFRVLRIFERFHFLRGEHFRESLLDTPLAVGALVELLTDYQEVVCASALQLFRELVPLAGPQLSQAIAFNGIYDRLFTIIRNERLSGSIADDCLRIIVGLLRTPAALALFLDQRRDFVHLLEIASARHLWTDVFGSLAQPRSDLVSRRIKECEKVVKMQSPPNVEGSNASSNSLTEFAPTMSTLGLLLAIADKLAQSCLTLDFSLQTKSSGSSASQSLAPASTISGSSSTSNLKSSGGQTSYGHLPIRSNSQTQTLLAPLVAPLALIALSEPPGARVLHAYSVSQFVDAFLATGGTLDTISDASKSELIQFHDIDNEHPESSSLSSMTVTKSHPPISQLLMGTRFPHTLYPLPLEFRLQSIAILSKLCLDHRSNQNILCNLDLPSLTSIIPLGPHALGLAPMPMSSTVPSLLQSTSTITPAILSKFRVAPHQSHGNQAPDMLLVPAPFALVIRALDSGSTLESDACRNLFAIALYRNTPVQSAIAQALGSPVITLGQTLYAEIAWNDKTDIKNNQKGMENLLRESSDVLLGSSLHSFVLDLEHLASAQMPRLLNRNLLLGQILAQTLAGSAGPGPYEVASLLEEPPAIRKIGSTIAKGIVPRQVELSEVRTSFVGESDPTPNSCLGSSSDLVYNHLNPQATSQEDAFLISCLRMSRAASILEHVIDDAPLLKLSLLLEPSPDGSPLTALDTSTLQNGHSQASTLLRLFVSHTTFWRRNAQYLAQVQTFGDSPIGKSSHLENPAMFVKEIKEKEPDLAQLLSVGLEEAPLIGAYSLPRNALRFSSIPSIYALTLSQSSNIPPNMSYGTAGKIVVEAGLVSLLSLLQTWVTDCPHFLDAMLMFPGVTESLTSLAGGSNDPTQLSNADMSITLPYVRALASSVLATIASVYSTRTNVAPDLLAENMDSKHRKSTDNEFASKIKKRLSVSSTDSANPPEHTFRAEEEELRSLSQPLLALNSKAGSVSAFEGGESIKARLALSKPSFSSPTVGPHGNSTSSWLSTLPKPRHIFAFQPNMLFSLLSAPNVLQCIRSVLKGFEESNLGLNAVLGSLPARLNPAKGDGKISSSFSYTFAPENELGPVHERTAAAFDLLNQGGDFSFYISFSVMDQCFASFSDVLSRILEISETDPVFYTSIHSPATPQSVLSATGGTGAFANRAYITSISRSIASACALGSPKRIALISRSPICVLGSPNLFGRVVKSARSLDRSILVLYAINAASSVNVSPSVQLDVSSELKHSHESIVLKERISELETQLTLLQQNTAMSALQSHDYLNSKAPVASHLHRISELEQEIENIRIASSEQLLAERVKNRTEFLEASLTALERDRTSLMEKLQDKEIELDNIHSACANARARALELESELQFVQASASLVEAERDDLLDNSRVLNPDGSTMALSQIELAYQELAARFEALNADHEDLLIVLAMMEEIDEKSQQDSEEGDDSERTNLASDVATAVSKQVEHQEELYAKALESASRESVIRRTDSSEDYERVENKFVDHNQNMIYETGFYTEQGFSIANTETSENPEMNNIFTERVDNTNVAYDSVTLPATSEPLDVQNKEVFTGEDEESDVLALATFAAEAAAADAEMMALAEADESTLYSQPYPSSFPEKTAIDAKVAVTQNQSNPSLDLNENSIDFVDPSVDQLLAALSRQNEDDLDLQ